MLTTAHRADAQAAAWQPLRRLSLLALFAAVALLVGCATGTRPGAGAGPPAATWPERDGPEANPPPGLANVPDAEPVLEPIRVGGPNKPYEALGQAYVPMTQDKPFSERGLASWYGRKFHGRRTASGEVYDMYAMTAAHPTLPIPSYARVRNPANGREVVVRINDRGPFHSTRIVDLSYTAALKLDVLRGVTPVELERITYDDIRTGAWRRTAPVDAVRVAAPNLAPITPSVPIAGVPVIVASTAVAPVSAAPPTSASATASARESATVSTTAPGYWVQLGAFRRRDGAETFRQRVAAELDWLSPLLAVVSDASLYRLQAGPYPDRDQANNVAERVRDGLQLVPVIVERR
jgi:rare lipoprotein A